ncbi:hypothetical protein ABLE91_20015 [Aquabacter sp. CN5-332]|uniref:hypothetical protein n=1 Tax=Aquabacter sp. CN5-332 TaxID=3156608 RepID=UPI0032B57BBC
MPLSTTNPLKGSEVSTQAQDVAWRRVCGPVRRGPVVVTRCNNVWVGPPRGRGYYGNGPRPGPGYGYGAPGPRYGYGAPGPRYGYGGPPRVGIGFY